jgi:hypothetical protein
MINDFKVLDTFLETWRIQAYNYYINLISLDTAKRNKEYEITKENLQLLTEYAWSNNRKYTDEKVEEILNNLPKLGQQQIHNLKGEIKYQNYEKWKRTYNKSDFIILNKITCYGSENTQKVNELLNKILDKDIEAKRKGFISKITKVVGDILDLEDLKIGVDGSINGIVKGSICNAKVTTIYAGGENIQCLHYRVLVKKIK